MRKDFDKIIQSHIEEGLGLLGEDVKKVILWFWESKSGKSAEMIPSHIEQFSKILRDFFDAGAAILEKRIAVSINRSFGFIDEPAGLVHAVRMAKERFQMNELGMWARVNAEKERLSDLCQNAQSELHSGKQKETALALFTNRAVRSYISPLPES